MLNDIYWIKFKEGEIACICSQNSKKCIGVRHPLCKEYVLKFIEVKRDNLEEIQEPIRQLKRKMTELQKSIKRFKI